MTPNTQQGTSVPTGLPVGLHALRLPGLLALLLVQAVMTAALFRGEENAFPSPIRVWHRLLDDEPILSGRHPLHLYHGWLGVRSLFERGSLCCYDPAFHAGYPKTPVFDSASRPAELALALIGAGWSPPAYKIMLALCCLVAPLMLYKAARAGGMRPGPSLLGAGLALAVWWGRPGCEALEAGDLDLLVGTLALLLQTALLARYHHSPGVLSLTGVVLSGGVAWFAHPLLALLSLPLFLIYYFTVGLKHRPAWHLPLVLGLIVALAMNAFWLLDWVGYWWIQVPAMRDTAATTSLLRWLLPGEGSSLPLGGLFAVALVGGAVIGLIRLHRTGRRVWACLSGWAALSFVGLAIAGAGREPFIRMGAGQLLFPALIFCALPAALALATGLERLLRQGTRTAPAAVAGCLVLFPILAVDTTGSAKESWFLPRPLQFGSEETRRGLVEAIQRKTGEEARILWEDQSGSRTRSRWTALLPMWTKRAFVGGLDFAAGIEHTASGLADGRLAGRPITEMDDDELEAYCRRYNVGWVVSFTPETTERLNRWRLTKEAEELPTGPGEKGRLYRVRREKSYALVGKATWCGADARGIQLSEVEPVRLEGEKEGQVVLSLHYQAGMRVSPGRVKLEKAVDSQDTIPFVRLRMSEPAGRILISWEGR